MILYLQTLMRDTQLFMIIGICIIAYAVYAFQSKEGFWGGYFPVVYAGQPLVQYGRTGIDAATEKPKFLMNANACPVNPHYCENCKGYRCCC